MKVFHCDHCQQLVFFENVSCIKCGHALAYLPDIDDMASLEPADGDTWKSHAGKTYRLCENYSKENICNWAVSGGSSGDAVRVLSLDRVIPDLGVSGNREKWYRLEVAKRRLLYSLRRLKLPFGNSVDRATGLRFEFLADGPEPNGDKVLTGHNEGRITINLAEADDGEREKRRLAMHEPYRTLLGHFRHEIGHYYWDRLIEGTERVEPFRALVWRRAPRLRGRLSRTITIMARPRIGRTTMSALMPACIRGRTGQNLGPLLAHHRCVGDGSRKRALAPA